MTERIALVLSCEHGGCEVPPEYRPLFRGATAVLKSHRGWDPGSRAMGEFLAERLDAPLFVHAATRLLVDANRSLHHRRLFSEFTRDLSADDKRRLVDTLWRPHRARVEEAVDRAIRRDGRVLHVCVHSFTPVLDGEERRADLALLYDPRRAPERTLCARWTGTMAGAAPDLRIRRNYPYRGVADGFTTHLRRRHAPGRYLGVELELNQGLAGSPGARRDRVLRLVAATLAAAVGGR